MNFHSTWHIMHFIIACITGGFWIPFWIVIALRNQQKNQKEMMKMNYSIINKVVEQ